MSNIGIFGGTFNPVHNGHVRLVQTVSQAIDFEKIIVMPDRIPPHKQADELVSGEDRLNMCAFAFEDMENVEISDWELRQSGKSYTIFTLEHLKMLYPNDKLWLIMGSDMLLCFDKWYRYEDIMKLASIVCISRCDGDSDDVLEEYAQRLSGKAEGFNIVIVKAQPLEVSSSMLREELKKMSDTSCYFPKKIVQYIYEHNLYND